MCSNTLWSLTEVQDYSPAFSLDLAKAVVQYPDFVLPGALEAMLLQLQHEASDLS